ncbi:MAG: alpha/beta hydrolase [Streptosporangiaceae bacterium]|nr:alpha/beta hydrolase [Streptosporangiaceae bacterium]MBV9855708.1 alpha/beta hydrolase [Streptosporangiaceae bacterium]
MSYLDVNGLSLRYEEHGAGEPLILLHGGLGSGDMFGPVMPELSARHRVITPDLQAHGGTADIGRPLRYETMADDVAALIGHLGLAQVDVMGFSLGAGAALRLAIQHPELVRRLVLVSVPCRRDGWFPEVLATFGHMGAQLAEMMKPSPIYQAYARVAPRVEDWPRLLDKVGDLQRQDYDWTAEVKTITAPVMLVYGDADSVRPEHIVEFYGLLGGGQRDGHWDGSLRPASRLAILPGRVHTDVFAAPALVPATLEFLEAKDLVPPSMEAAQAG